MGVVLIRKSFYFIRHGETEHNFKSLCAGGKIDTPLNKQGIEQAILLRKNLKDKKFDFVFSSPLKRAVDTAFLATGQMPQISFDLREWELGDFENGPVEDFFNATRTLPFSQCLPNGESKEGFFQRSIAALNEILHAEGTSLIVAHGGTYWAILHALGLPHSHIGNAECIYFEGKDSLKPNADPFWE